jgi:hypothetical protein
MKAAEIFLVVLMIVLVFCMVLGLYAFFIHTITGINIFVFEDNLQSNEQQLPISETQIRDSLKSKMVDGIATMSRFVTNLKSHGLFVTLKLTLLFIQVLLGTLPRLDLDVDGSCRPESDELRADHV